LLEEPVFYVEWPMLDLWPTAFEGPAGFMCPLLVAWVFTFPAPRFLPDWFDVVLLKKFPPFEAIWKLLELEAADYYYYPELRRLLCPGLPPCA
jgi:hypothetical protein